MKNIKGFTLVEVLASIVLLSILFMIAVPSVTKLQESSNIKQIEADAKVFVELVRQKIESDTSYSGPSHPLDLDEIDQSKLSAKYISGTVEASSCGYVGTSDIYECQNFNVTLENDNYKATGTVNGGTINITGSKK